MVHRDGGNDGSEVKVSRHPVDLVSVQDLIDTASDLIRIPSFKGGGEAELADWLYEYFDDRGYSVQMQEVSPGRRQPIATLPGTRRETSQSLMFNGHMDIDPLRGGWLRDPWTPTVDGDVLYGAGARNMKGGLATMLVAAEAIRQSGVTLDGDLVIACVLGELEGGKGTAHLMESGVRTDMAVLPEPLGADTLITTFAGVLQLAISTIGFSEHISRKNDSTVDAIEQMAKLIPALKRIQFRGEIRDDLPDLPMLNVGGVIGGRGRDYDLRGPNYVSDYCTALVDIRYQPGLTREQVLGDVRSALEELSEADPTLVWEVAEEFHEQFGFQPGPFEPTEVPTSEYIVQAVARHYREVTGLEPAGIGSVVPWSYAAGDTSHLWRAGIPCLFYGPNSPPRVRGDSDDGVSISQMLTVSRVLTLTALDVCGRGR
jgi:acetylornithine deacetylase